MTLAFLTLNPTKSHEMHFPGNAAISFGPNTVYWLKRGGLFFNFDKTRFPDQSEQIQTEIKKISAKKSLGRPAIRCSCTKCLTHSKSKGIAWSHEIDVPKCCEKLNGIECISKHAERDNDHDDSWFWMMPGNASGLGMGKDDYLTERILGINLSLTRERGMGLGRPELLHVPSFFHQVSQSLILWARFEVSTCGHVNAYYRMHKSCCDYAVPDIQPYSGFLYKWWQIS